MPRLANFVRHLGLMQNPVCTKYESIQLIAP